MHSGGGAAHQALLELYASALLTGVYSEPHRPQMTTVTPGQRGSGRDCDPEFGAEANLVQGCGNDSLGGVSEMLSWSSEG